MQKSSRWLLFNIEIKWYIYIQQKENYEYVLNLLFIGACFSYDPKFGLACILDSFQLFGVKNHQ